MRIEALSVQMPHVKCFVASIAFVSATLLIYSPGFCEQWEKAESYAEQYSEQAGKDAAAAQTMVNGQREKLLKEITLLEESLQAAEARLKESKAHFEGLLQQEESIGERLRQEEHDAEKVMELYLAARKDVEAMLTSSLINAQNPLLQAGENESGPASAPSFVDIKQLVEALFTVMESSGKIERYRGAFIGPGGTSVEGEILRLGDINGFYRRTPGNVGFVKIDKTSGKLEAIPVADSWFDRDGERINDYFDGKTDVLPVDLSRGEILIQYDSERDVLEWLHSGGGLVWPILMVGLVAFLLIVERLIFLLRVKTNSEKLMARIQQLAAKDRWQECQEYCSKHDKAPVCRVLRAGLGSLGGNGEILENALQEAFMRELPRLERFLSTISVLAAVAPLLGLLGTVSGMINTFHAITIYGTGDPRMLSGGISEALITTQLGLMVAVPVLILHHFLERRVDAIIGEMEEKSTALTGIMIKNRGIHGAMVSRTA